jgi:hypothetical protein
MINKNWFSKNKMFFFDYDTGLSDIYTPVSTPKGKNLYSPLFWEVREID